MRMTAVVFVLAVFATACGGGGSPAAPSGAPPPPVASDYFKVLTIVPGTGMAIVSEGRVDFEAFGGDTQCRAFGLVAQDGYTYVNDLVVYTSGARVYPDRFVMSVTSPFYARLRGRTYNGVWITGATCGSMHVDTQINWSGVKTRVDVPLGWQFN